MPESDWRSSVGEVGHGTINVRGYALAEIIERLTFPEAAYLTIRGELPDDDQTRVFNAVLCAILEHGFYTPTTLAARMIASATTDTIIPAIAGSLLTIGGVTASPQHTGELICKGLALMAAGSSQAEAVARLVDDLLASSERMPGVGHPLHPEGDPRARAVSEIVAKCGLRTERTELFEATRDAFVERLGRPLPVNVDGAMGCALSELSFLPVEMAGIAALSFMPGLIAHSVEELTGPTRLRIAEGVYEGVGPRSIPAR
jgi:citryl-CoA lyase